MFIIPRKDSYLSASFITVLLPLLTCNLHLSLMARSIGEIQVLLANEFLSRQFDVGGMDFSQCNEGFLLSSFGRNLPVADCDFMVARLIFGAADTVPGHDASSQRANSIKQNGPFRIKSYSVAIVVALSDLNAS